MTFHFRVTAAEYDEGFGETVLIGELESGRLGGGAHIRVPTASGSFESTVVSIEGPGPDPPPYRAEKVRSAKLYVGVRGHPPGHDISAPCNVMQRSADTRAFIFLLGGRAPADAGRYVASVGRGGTE